MKSFSLRDIATQVSPKPPRILMHGVAGVGKTTFAAQALNPVFVITEDGLGVHSYAHFPLARSFDQVLGALATLWREPHSYRTVVIDSLDWLEPLIWKKVCEEKGWGSIEDPGYGKGYMVALNLWRDYVEGLNALRNDRDMTVVQLSHTDIRRFESPEHDPYDRYQVKLHARTAALVQEHADVVLFANYRVTTTRAETGFNKVATRAIGTGERLMHTSERPSYMAKNRYALPATLPLGWSALADAMPQALRPWLTDAPPAATQPAAVAVGAAAAP